MKVVKVNGRNVKVFALRQTEEALIYIPVNSIQRIDYNRLIDIESRGGDMLTEMRKTKLDNGLNALAMYDDVIQVMHYKPRKQDEGIRLPKPEDAMIVQKRYEEEMQRIESEKEKMSVESQLQQQEVKGDVNQHNDSSDGEKPKKRRGPGRPPKSQKTED